MFEIHCSKAAVVKEWTEDDPFGCTRGPPFPNHIHTCVRSDFLHKLQPKLFSKD